MKAALAFAMLACAASVAQAQGGPPYLTDDPGTPGPKHWEINIALPYEHRPTDYLVQVPDIDINFGVGDRVQLKYETAWNIAHVDTAGTESALANSHFGIKWRFLDRKSAPLDVSFYPQFDFNPVSSAEFGLLDRGTELLLPVETATSLGSIDVAAEAGYNIVFGGIDGLIYGIVVAHSIGHLAVGAEIHGEADVDFATNELAINLGAGWELTHRYSLLASVGRSPRGASSGEPDLLAYLGLQLRL